MIEKRPTESLGTTRFNGANTLHHFCFGPYQSAERLGWGSLRMLNRVQLEATGKRDPNFLGQMEILLIGLSGKVIVQCGERRRHLKEGGIAHIDLRAGCDYGIANSGEGPSELIELWLTTDCWQGRPKTRLSRLTHRQSIVASHRRQDMAASQLPSVATIALLDTARATVDRHLIVTEGHAYVCTLGGETRVGEVRCGPDQAVAIEGEKGLSVQMTGPGKCLVIECPTRRAG